MSTAQCVDYYYHTVKRRKRRIQRPRRFRHDSEGEDSVKRSFSPSPNESHSDDDFMRVPIIKAEELTEYQDTSTRYTRAEVVRRSPASTAYVRAPLRNEAVTTYAQNPPALIDFSHQGKNKHSAVQHYQGHQITSLSTPPHQTVPVKIEHGFTAPPTYRCKIPSCVQAFHTPQQLVHHQQSHKTMAMKPYLGRINRASPSPASSPGSVASVDTETPQPVFSCPRCGKTFGKVKSRNAHMKTHGKHAQEKRKQKEEEARRKMEEAAAWRNRAQQQSILPPGPGRGKGILQFNIKPPGM